jgi:hypothetical protein
VLHSRAAQGSPVLAGFFVESFASIVSPSAPIKLLDLGGCEVVGQFQAGSVRSAWAHWSGSSQWRIDKAPGRVLLIEGQPDRLPKPGESVEQWLYGRSGSFRGFEIAIQGESAPPRITLFTDPLCTRPVYLLHVKDRLYASDKLATIALNAAGLAEPNWSGLLECAAIGSLYSHKTTLKDALLLPPGEAMEFEGSKLRRRWKNTLPVDSSLNQAEVRKNPADTLQFALTKAVKETWTDPETRLLLSGGLDSRILLAVASGKRKALTLEMYSHETVVAKEVGAAAGAALDVVPAPDYEYPLRWAYLVTGAMHDSRFTTHLGLVEDWRKRGIPGIVHGYFHNTMYRGWTVKKYERFPNTNSVLFRWMGNKGYYFDRYGCMPALLAPRLYAMLSPDGQAILKKQLKELANSLQTVIVDGYDLTFERRLMEFVPRQVYFSVMLGWYEAVDVCSPVFQPALWTWYALSSPKARDRDWAIREVFLHLNHPVAKLPDSNTGAPISHLKLDWKDRVRNQFWYPPLRALYQGISKKPPSSQESLMKWGPRLRNHAGLSIMEEAISQLTSNPLFNREKIEADFDAFRSGDNSFVDPLCAITSMGQWLRLVKRPDSLNRFVHVLEDTKVAN